MIEMTAEEKFAQTDFSKFSKVKDSLLLRLKLRRRAINKEMSLDELDMVAAAGTATNKPVKPSDMFARVSPFIS